jgi:hypothetical protein
MKISKCLTYFIFCIILFTACKKPKTFPSEPVIVFKDLVKHTNEQGIDDSLKLIISFTDGDGDIGLAQSDTLAPYNPGSVYYFDFYIKYFIKHNGNFEEIPLLVGGQKIPFIKNEGKDKSLSGDIVMQLDIFGFQWNNDTLKFEAYIYDRALHKSNTISTSEIIMKTL